VLQGTCNALRIIACITIAPFGGNDIVSKTIEPTGDLGIQKELSNFLREEDIRTNCYEHSGSTRNVMCYILRVSSQCNVLYIASQLAM